MLRAEGGAIAGDEVAVVDPRGNRLGRGFYSPSSALAARLFVRGNDDRSFETILRERLEAAIAHRRALGLGHDDTTGYRLIHAEGDGLPGLVVDRFGDVLVAQFLTLGMHLRRSLIVGQLAKLLAPSAILDRTPGRAAQLEGFELGSDTWLHGTPIESLDFTERGFRYEIPIGLGQKTGFYFDQRGVRARVEALAKGKRVLDAYGYVGAFTLAAARGGATEVHSVDDNLLATEVGAELARAHGYAAITRFSKNDARRELAAAHGSYDLVIVDPPRLAPTRSSQKNALLAYAKLAELGCRAVKPGGTLVFCSCSAAVDLGRLTRALAAGAMRANVTPYVLERHFQGADHPVPAAFDEGLYLKVLIARVDGAAGGGTSHGVDGAAGGGTSHGVDGAAGGGTSHGVDGAAGGGTSHGVASRAAGGA